MLAQISWEKISGDNERKTHRVNFETLPVKIHRNGYCTVRINKKDIVIGVKSKKQPTGVFLTPGALAHYINSMTGAKNYVRIHLINDERNRNDSWYNKQQRNKRVVTVKIKDLVRLKK